MEERLGDERCRPEQQGVTEYLALHGVDAVAVAVGEVGRGPHSEEDAGALPSSIQPARQARTVPSRRCLMPPNDLKIAPWRMSVPIAIAGLKLKRKIRIGVMSEPPPSRSSRRGR